jgi:hypothetical protein
MKFSILIQILMRSHVIDMAAQGHCFLPYTGLMNLQIWVRIFQNWCIFHVFSIWWMGNMKKQKCISQIQDAFGVLFVETLWL